MMDNGKTIQTKGTAEQFDITPPPDDLSEMNIPPDVAPGETPVEQELLRLYLGKPNKMEFFRTRPGELWKREAMILEVDAESGIGKARHLIVGHDLMRRHQQDLRRVLLRPFVYRDESVGLWPLSLSQTSAWALTAMAAAEKAETRWVRCVPGRRHNDIFLPGEGVVIPEPEWPAGLDTMEGYIRKAFGDNVIRDADHPELVKLGKRAE